MSYLGDIVRDSRRRPQKRTEPRGNAPEVHVGTSGAAVTSGTPVVQKTESSVAPRTGPAVIGKVKSAPKNQTSAVKHNLPTPVPKSPKAASTGQISSAQVETKGLPQRTVDGKTPKSQPELRSGNLADGSTESVGSKSRAVSRQTGNTKDKSAGKQQQRKKPAIKKKSPSINEVPDAVRISESTKKPASPLKSTIESTEIPVSSTEILTRDVQGDVKAATDQKSQIQQSGEHQVKDNTNEFHPLLQITTEARKRLPDLKSDVDQRNSVAKRIAGVDALEDNSTKKGEMDFSALFSRDNITTPSIDFVASKESGSTEIADGTHIAENENRAISDVDSKHDQDILHFQPGTGEQNNDSPLPVFQPPPAPASQVKTEAEPVIGDTTDYTKPEQSEPQVQIGLIEIVVSSPPGNAARPVPRTAHTGNFTSRHYLRRV